MISTFFLFNPSITFGLLSAEIFPYALIFYLFSIVINQIKINWYFIAFAIFLLIQSLMFSIFYNEFTIESLRSVAAYLNGPAALLLFMQGHISTKKFSVFIRYYFYFLSSLALLQYLDVIGFIDTFIKFLVPRGDASSESIIRGVNLLATEPSRAGFEYLIVYILFRKFNEIAPSQKDYFDLLVCFILLFVIKATTSTLFLVVYLYYFNRKFFFLVPILVFYVVFLAPDLSNRMIQLFAALLEQNSFSESINFLISESGFRFASIISAYNTLLINPLGYGVGFWSDGSVAQLINSGFTTDQVRFFLWFGQGEFFGVRPPSYFASLALDLGIFILAPFIPIIMLLRYIYTQVSPELSVIALLSFIIIGTVGSPIIWIAIGASYYLKNETKHSNNL